MVRACCLVCTTRCCGVALLHPVDGIVGRAARGWHRGSQEGTRVAGHERSRGRCDMDRFCIGGLIGQGGFGKVYEATRLDDGSTCAIKRLDRSTADELRRRFSREVRMQAQLRHANVVPIIEHDLTDQEPWYAMPRARCNLRQYIDGYRWVWPR